MIKSSEPTWITEEVVLALQARQIELFGGMQGIRDSSLIQSSLARPLQLFHYGTPPPDMYALAASYAYGFVKNHAFIDGNKRIAHMVYRLFLAKNGYVCRASLEDKYEKMMALASSKISEEEFANWLRDTCFNA